MARARQPLAKGCGVALLMGGARAWPLASMDEVAQLFVAAARSSFLQRNRAQMQALRGKVTISREEEALLGTIETRLEISRATGGINLPSSLSKSSRGKWAISKALSRAVSNQVTAIVLQ